MMGHVERILSFRTAYEQPPHRHAANRLRVSDATSARFSADKVYPVLSKMEIGRKSRSAGIQTCAASKPETKAGAMSCTAPHPFSSVIQPFRYGAAGARGGRNILVLFGHIRRQSLNVGFVDAFS